MQLNEIDDFDISIISDPHVLSFDLIADTEDFNKEIRLQASLAMDEADVIVFVVDGKDVAFYLIRHRK